MKKFTYLLAALAVAGTASAQMRHQYRMIERQAPQVIVEEAMMQKAGLPTAAELRAMVNENKFDAALKVGVQSSKEFGSMTEYQPLAAKYCVNETFDSFTKGTQQNPVKMPNGNISGLDSELRFFGLHDIGSGLALLQQQAGVDADAIVWIDNIDLSRGPVSKISIDVCALSAGTELNLAIYDRNNSQVLNVYPITLDADGYLHPIYINDALPQTAGYSNIAFAWFESNAKPMVIDNIICDATFSDKWDEPDPNPTPAPTTAPSNIKADVARSKTSFNISYSAAKGATHHQALVYNDVYTYGGLPTFNYVNADFSSYVGGTTEPYNPSLAAYSRDAHAGSFPGADLHYVVLIDGAIGFGHHPQLFDETGVMAGFETPMYDFSASKGACRVKFNYYATIGTGIYFAEVAWNNKTNGWDIVDSFSADGHFDEAGNNNGLCWHQDDPWDFMDIQTDPLDMNVYSGEVYFCLYLYSVMSYDDLEMLGFDSEETAPASVPVYFYMTDFSIDADNLEADNWFYYVYKDPIVQGNQTISVQAPDIANNNYNFFVRGINIVTSGAQAGTAYGPWGGDENGNSVYLHPLVPEVGVQDVMVDKAENAVYYNLHGQRVANPEKGIFIRQTNGRTEKVVK